MYIDSEILQKLHNHSMNRLVQEWFMAAYCHAKPLLETVDAQKVSIIFGISENERTLKLIRVSGSD